MCGFLYILHGAYVTHLEKKSAERVGNHPWNDYALEKASEVTWLQYLNNSWIRIIKSWAFGASDINGIKFNS